MLPLRATASVDSLNDQKYIITVFLCGEMLYVTGRGHWSAAAVMSSYASSAVCHVCYIAPVSRIRSARCALSANDFHTHLYTVTFCPPSQSIYYLLLLFLITILPVDL